MQGPVEFLLTGLLAAVASQQDVYQGSYSLVIPANPGAGNNLQMITYPDNAPQQQQGQLYAVSLAQQEEVHREQLLEIEKQQQELQRQQQEVQRQKQEVQVKQPQLQSKVQKRLRTQQPFQQQGHQQQNQQQDRPQQNQQQSFVFQRPQQQQVQHTEPQRQQELRKILESQRQSQLFNSQRQKELAQQRKFQQEQPKSQSIPPQQSQKFQVFRPNLQSSQFQLNLNLTPQQKQFQQTQQAPAPRFQQTQQAPAPRFPQTQQEPDQRFQRTQQAPAPRFQQTQQAQASQFQAANQGRFSQNRRPATRVARPRPAAASPASPPAQQRFSNFSPSRLPSTPSVGQRERFQVFSAVTPGPPATAPAAVHNLQSQPETAAGSGDTGTGAGDHVPELSRFQLFQIKKYQHQPKPTPEKTVGLKVVKRKRKQG